jgi:hypothetical protein
MVSFGSSPAEWQVPAAPAGGHGVGGVATAAPGGGAADDLRQRLGEDLAGLAVVLHHCRLPDDRGRIDHLVVAPSGVWIIHARSDAGRVEQRDVGGWLSADVRLYVGNRNETRLVHGLVRQVDAVRSVVASTGFGHSPLHPALCFGSSQWGLFAKPIRINDVLVTWAAKLVDLIRAPGPLDHHGIDAVASVLSAELPPAP